MGFDEKFIVRAPVRNKIQRKDRLIAILPEDYEEESRAVMALNNLKELLRNIVSEGAFEVLLLPR